VTAHLERIDRLNPAVNAIVTLVPEQALEAADAADRRRLAGEELPPLHGLPIAHKDLVDTAGVRTTYGSPIFAEHVPATDALLVSRLRDAGTIMLGKTNTPEFGTGSHTFNPVFGPTLNPWNTARSAGGSSGGAAAALACRMVPLADGSDLGGSLRNPAAWNSVVGLRPTPGVVPSWPDSAPWIPYAVDGPMARTVDDVALMLAAMSGPDVRAPLSTGIPRFEVPPTLEADLTGRSIGWTSSLSGLPVEQDIHQVLVPVVEGLTELGLSVEQMEPNFRGQDEVFEVWRAYLMAVGLEDLYLREGHRMKDTLRWNIELGLNLETDMLMQTELWRGEIAEAVADTFERYDYVVCPVTQLSPFPVELEYPTEVAGATMSTYLEWMRSCSRITSWCCPAMSVPAGFTSEGLPVGLQLVARPFAERSLLELAHAIEASVGIADRLPHVAL
jgi:amidase